MKASELVKQLQDNMKQFGDLEVTSDTGNLITGINQIIEAIGEGTSHFELDQSCINVDEFGASIESHMADGMDEKQARKAAFEEVEKYYSY